ncbi:ATP-binding cassette domain-containing protein [Microbulbifer variabilis]|uniref:ATP-binding cassette domain-containing protein n=1 Tax=Microbulbifer variabilis TaxID=266805 RepID=A0ABY4VAP7_9GAMM|nr:ATP-binding cassette domain-containing protein [Microbulbifer variabilis]USD21020.1 ATP-binding cassette domain-containing protein [Microbulbifer variabilis]
MSKLHIENLSNDLLQKVDLAIAPGEVVCLSGPSGSGKSRLLRAIADVDPHNGQISLGNNLQEAMPGHQWRRQVMLVPAQSAWWYETVGEHFNQPMGQTLKILGFPEEATKWQVSRLSSGEKQRLALIRALSYTPQALLLDEPTANLDADTTSKVEAWLKDEISKQQYPVIWVAHNREQIQRVASRHIEIQGSCLVERELSK